MRDTLNKINAIASESLTHAVPVRDGLPAHVWAYQLREELERAQEALMQIQTEIREAGAVVQNDDDAQNVMCEGCHAIVSSDLTERGLCQRCRS